MKKLIIECIGTFFFILTIALTGNPFAIASMLMAWVYIGGYISGGHYNPMVSLAIAIRGKLSWDKVPGYMTAQIIGGFAAFAGASFLQNKSGVIPHPAAGVSLVQAFIVEILLAFALALIILVVATAEQFKGSHIFGFAIGFTIPALAFIGGPISGGLFNPAIALGAAGLGLLQGISVNYSHLIMYVAGALIGGALAGYFFKYFFIENK